MTTETKAQIDHSAHDHPATPQARERCRKQRDHLLGQVTQQARIVYIELGRLAESVANARSAMDSGMLPMTAAGDSQIIGVDLRRLDQANAKLQVVLDLAGMYGLTADEMGAAYAAGVGR
jgi:hypothetical protein